jgi:hypothetical protein
MSELRWMAAMLLLLAGEVASANLQVTANPAYSRAKVETDDIEAMT